MINVGLFYNFRMLFCWPIAGYQNSGGVGPCQRLPEVVKKHKFPKHTGTFGKSGFRKNFQKSVGLFNDFQWFCNIWLFLKNEKRFLKVRRPRSLRSARRWPFGGHCLARSAPRLRRCPADGHGLRRFFIFSFLFISPFPSSFSFSFPFFSFLFFPSPLSPLFFSPFPRSLPLLYCLLFAKQDLNLSL